MSSCHILGRFLHWTLIQRLINKNRPTWTCDLGLFGVWKETMVVKHGDESHGIESLRSPSDGKIFIPPLALSNQVRTNGNYRCNCWPSQSFFMIFSSDRFRKKSSTIPLVPWCFSDKKGWRSVASIWFLPTWMSQEVSKSLVSGF